MEANYKMRNLTSVLYFSFDIKVLKPERPVSLEAVREFLVRDIQCISQGKEKAQNKITDFLIQTLIL
jgi:hypothetical protein